MRRCLRVKTRRGQLGLASGCFEQHSCFSPRVNRILSAVQNTLCAGPSSQAPPHPPQASPPAAPDHSRTPSLLASSHSASGGESLFQLYMASLAWPQNCCVLESCRRIPLGGLSSMENRRPLLRKGRLLRGQIHHGQANQTVRAHRGWGSGFRGEWSHHLLPCPP
uniref:Uncharacterized protein n=2 Tax=Rhinopithecus TaxID=542827 RepID=A0A2K6KMC8_RHIBE